jgi:hypothetical protein
MATYPYCIHGNYVGGCGIDYMCHSCEMGETFPTYNEMKAYLANAYAELRKLIADCSGNNLMIGLAIWRVVSPSKIAKIQSITAQLKEMRLYDADAFPDSDGWGYRLHEANAHRWIESTNEEQFADLPAYVLDGSY